MRGYFDQCYHLTCRKCKWDGTTGASATLSWRAYKAAYRAGGALRSSLEISSRDNLSLKTCNAWKWTNSTIISWAFLQNSTPSIVTLTHHVIPPCPSHSDTRCALRTQTTRPPIYSPHDCARDPKKRCELHQSFRKFQFPAIDELWSPRWDEEGKAWRQLMWAMIWSSRSDVTRVTDFRSVFFSAHYWIWY